MTRRDDGERQKQLRKAWVIASAAVIAIVLIVTVLIVKPTMPDRIVLLTGPEGSSYHDLAMRYAADLARRGLEADVTVTDGTLDDLRQLTAGGNVVAFMPSTVDRGEAGLDTSELVALGSVGLEPLWLFYRADLDISRIPDLAGKRVMTGGSGTVTDHVARMLVERNGIAGEVELRTVEESLEEVREGFSARSIDAVFATGHPDSPFIETMLGDDGVRFLSFDRAETYAALIPGVKALRLLEGILDIARNIPRQDAELLSATTCLIAHQDLHPAVVPMLLIVAENVRQGLPTYSTRLTFPNSEHLPFPLDPAARRYFSNGETGLAKFLPYKVTRFLNHIGLLVIPLLTLVVLMLKVVPLGLRVWGQLRLTGLFKRLESVEKRNAAGVDRDRLLSELDQIDQVSARMFVPRAIVQDYVDFRQFVHDMRERVASGEG